MDGAQEAHEVMARAARIVVLTGAGISTDSGIPDFRGPQGVWTKDPSAMRSSNIADYVADPEAVSYTHLTLPTTERV